MTTTVLFMLFSLWLVFATQYREGYAQSGVPGNRAGETICRLEREQPSAGWALLLFRFIFFSGSLWCLIDFCNKAMRMGGTA
ncbi:hypothetical protein [Rhizobium mongolense]|uniref:hypothetical protein n=1 Tax=Rhizobium mongolense TaxID=57676 RepID=UPI0011138B90|nr:hypothetical protein [Rhizobium mongolense]